MRDSQINSSSKLFNSKVQIKKEVQNNRNNQNHIILRANLSFIIKNNNNISQMVNRINLEDILKWALMVISFNHKAVKFPTLISTTNSLTLASPSVNVHLVESQKAKQSQTFKSVSVNHLNNTSLLNKSINKTTTT